MDEPERERWRGEVDADVRTLKDNVKILFATARQADRELHDLEIRVTALTVKFAAASMLGAVVGSGLMQYLFHLLK